MLLLQNMSHDSFICVLCLIRLCAATHNCVLRLTTVCCDSQLCAATHNCVPWLVVGGMDRLHGVSLYVADWVSLYVAEVATCESWASHPSVFVTHPSVFVTHSHCFLSFELHRVSLYVADWVALYVAAQEYTPWLMWMCAVSRASVFVTHSCCSRWYEQASRGITICHCSRTYAMTRSRLCRASFICVPWLNHLCSVTHSSMRNDML